MDRLLALALGALFAGACSDGNDDPIVPDPDSGVDPDGGGISDDVHWMGGAAPNFALRDVNPSSPSYGERVGPRDYLGTVSAWFFGWAT
jgi:hypothetical protein